MRLDLIGGTVFTEFLAVRLWLSGPRISGIRLGVSLGKRDLEKIFKDREPTSVSAEADNSSFLYVVKGGNRVTVGLTPDPRGRLAALQTGSVLPLEFAWIGAPQGQAMGIEHDAHGMLEKYRCNDGWFEVTPDAAVGAIAACAQRRGMNILGCTPELADQIIQAGAVQDARQRRKNRMVLWAQIVLIAVSGIAAAAIAIRIMTGG